MTLKCEVCGDKASDKTLPCVECRRDVPLCDCCWRYRSGANGRGKRQVYCEGRHDAPAR